MKNEIGDQLARSLAFYWRIYKRNQQRKKEEAERKKKAKAAKKKKKKGTSLAMKNVQSKTGSFTSKSSSTNVTNAASMARKKTITKKDVPDNTAEKEAEEPPSPQPDCGDLKAEENMDKALAQFGALGMMGKGIMQTVPEENQSPRVGSDQEDEVREVDHDDLSRAGISTRGMNRGGKK